MSSVGPTIDVNELPADVRKQLNLKKRRVKRPLQMEKVRQCAIKVLAVLTDLTQRERERVLRHALKANDV